MWETFWQKDDKQVDRKDLCMLFEEKNTPHDRFYNNGHEWVI